MRTGIELPKDAPPPPDAAVVMVKTRAINDFLGTNYTLDAVADMDWLTFDMMGVLKKAEGARKDKPQGPKGPKKPEILRGRK